MQNVLFTLRGFWSSSLYRRQAGGEEASVQVHGDLGDARSQRRPAAGRRPSADPTVTSPPRRAPSEFVRDVRARCRPEPRRQRRLPRTARLPPAQLGRGRPGRSEGVGRRQRSDADPASHTRQTRVVAVSQIIVDNLFRLRQSLRALVTRAL